MPFCPKCKYEYKEGIKICADCNVELVDSLADVSVTILTREEDTIDEALEFLIANNFNGAYKEESDTFDNLFDLKVPESKRKEASDMLNVYYREVHEASEEEKELEEEIKINRDNSSRYVNLDDKAENYRSGAVVLIGMGIAGAVFLILVNIGVFNLPVPSSTKTLINIVMGGLFAEAPVVPAILAEILLIVELILLIKFKELNESLTASANQDKEFLVRADWIYILFIAIVLLSCGPILFDPDMDYLDSVDTEFGEIMVFLVGSPPFVGILLGAAGLGALFIYAINGITFLIVLVVLDMLWCGYLIYAGISDAL